VRLCLARVICDADTILALRAKGFAFGQAVPVTLFYQYAWRFERGLGDLHLFGVGL
jgi:hypothetical protein